jgi:hypothetical protein
MGDCWFQAGRLREFRMIVFGADHQRPEKSFWLLWVTVADCRLAVHEQAATLPASTTQPRLARRSLGKARSIGSSQNKCTKCTQLHKTPINIGQNLFCKCTQTVPNPHQAYPLEFMNCDDL